MRTLEYYISAVESRLYDFIPESDVPQIRVISAGKYSLSAGGKRIRPILVLAFCEMCGGDMDKAVDVACALEYMHTFSLIHDDLPCMDDDDLRRGRKSCHKAFDEATALLAGDALAILPFEIISKSAFEGKISPLAAVKCTNELARLCGVNGMIGGQQIDTENEGKELSSDVLLSMYAMKTSALLKAACLCGVYCAESDDETVYAEKAAAYAHNLGLAFQIIDDILDVISTEEELGKPIGSDADSDKHTYVSVYGLQASRTAAEKYTKTALSALDSFENNAFLKELTNKLLKRNK